MDQDQFTDEVEDAIFEDQIQQPAKEELSVMSYVSKVETMEFFKEGLRQAASAAIQLAAAQNHPIWADIATLCQELEYKGLVLSNAKALSRQDRLVIVDKREAALNQKIAAAEKPKLIMN